MTHIVLVRHGESVWHGENRYTGSSDIDLTRNGYDVAVLLAQWAAEARLDALWVSPLKRTRETAKPVALATGLDPHIDERLRELDFGQGEGCTLDEMKRLFPQAITAFREDPVAHHLPGGEDPRAAAARVISCLNSIAAVYPQGRVLVVMHSTVLRLTLCQLLGLPLSLYRHLFPLVRNCALTEIELTEGEAALLSFNVPVDDKDR